MAVDQAPASHEAQVGTNSENETKNQPDDVSAHPTSPTNPKTASTATTQNNPPSEIADGMDTTSPTATSQPPAGETAAGPVPLDSALRTTPIHPSLPSVKVPATAVAGSTEPNTNPITLKPFTKAELSKYGFEKLRAQVSTRNATSEAGNGAASGGGVKVDEEEVKKLREQTTALLKHKLEEREGKIREIEREIEEKEKIREVERKVFRKKMGNVAGASEG